VTAFLSESGQNSSPLDYLPSTLFDSSVVWTTDRSNVGVRRLLSGLGVHAMFDSNDRRDDQKRALECLRLASDLKQLANDTLNPDLKAHCLRMAKQWSDEADAPAKNNTSGNKALVH
jgi:hypothetical protein